MFAVVNRVAIPPTLSPEAARPPVGPVVHMGGPTMGVTWSAQAVLPEGLDPGAVQADVHRALNDLVGEVSGWDPQSDLSRINRAPTGSVYEAPEHLAAILKRALHWARESDGAFDPALGDLVDRWGFGPGGGGARGDWRALSLEGGRLVQPGLTLDLSGIAKGYGVDLAAGTLRDAGAAHFLVEIGGELRGEGVRPDGQPWWVAIETPPGLTVAEPVVVALHGAALATSGDFRRFALDAGRRQSHTLDPRTGAPVRNVAASVSVLAETCMDADALCTVLSVMGPDVGVDWADTRGVAAYWQLRGGPERMTAKFAEMLSD